MGQQTEVQPIEGRVGETAPRWQGLPWVRGVLVTLVAGPVLLVSSLFAASVLLSTFIAGWTPSNWFSDSPVDIVFGTGDAVNYWRFMLGVAPAAAAWAVIRWAWTRLP